MGSIDNPQWKDSRETGLAARIQEGPADRIRAPNPTSKPNKYRTDLMISLWNLCVDFHNMMREIDQARIAKGYIELTMLGEKRVEILRSMKEVLRLMEESGIEFDADKLIPSEMQIASTQGLEADNTMVFGRTDFCIEED